MTGSYEDFESLSNANTSGLAQSSSVLRVQNQSGSSFMNMSASAGYASATGKASMVKPNARTWVAIIVAMMGAMMFGLDQGNFGNVMTFDDFIDHWCIGKYGDAVSCGRGTPEQCEAALNSSDLCIGMTDAQACCDKISSENDAWNTGFVLWANTLVTIGAAAGSLLLAPIITSRFGRRLCISIGAGMCVTGCLISAFLTFGNQSFFLFCRFFLGFGIGTCCFALPMYNSEMATPSIRGMTGSLFQFNVVIGAFIATLITLAVQNWEFGLCLPAIPGAFVAIVIWFVPESPRYVMEKQGYDAATEILVKVRTGDVAPEAEEIKETIEEQQAQGKITYGQLFKTSAIRKRLFIACFLQIAQQLTGVNAFLGYASKIFAGIGMDDPFTFNTIWNAVMVVGVVTGLLLLDYKHGGRRIQLLGATFIMGPTLLIAAFAETFHWSGTLQMVMVCLYGFGFQLAWGMIPWIYPSEIFTMAEKDKAMSFAVFWQYTFNAIVVIVTPYLYTWSMSGTFFFFGGLNCLNLAFVFLFIKETKGVPLEEIPALFDKEQ